MAIGDTIKNIVDLTKMGLTVELREKIQLLREEALELQEENFKLKTENKELKEKSELQDKMKRKRNVYYLEGDEDPHCPHCYEKDQKPIHLIYKCNFANKMIHRCPVCSSEYSVIGNGDFEFYMKRK